MNRSAQMDEWLSKIEDHCEYEAHRGLIDINKLNLAECIVDAIEDAVIEDRENQESNAMLALKKIVTYMETSALYCQYGKYGNQKHIERIIKDTYGDL
jgi:hypothetical protein